MPKFTDSLVGENVEVATEYFKALVAESNKTSNSGGTIGFIPIGFSFTMDGLSGIKIYDKLNVDVSFLPPGYTKTIDFIVTGIDHRLKDGDWETNVKVTMIPKTDNIGQNQIIKGSVPIQTQQENTAPPPAPAASVPLEAAPSTPGGATQPTPSVPTGGIDFIFGDSIASGIATVIGVNRTANVGVKKSDSRGISQVGAPPSIILGFLKERQSELSGKNIILSGGLTNDVNGLPTIKKQLELLKSLNAKVYLVGVADEKDFAQPKLGATIKAGLKGKDAELKKLAESFGFIFLGGFESSDVIGHPKYSIYYQNNVKRYFK